MKPNGDAEHRSLPAGRGTPPVAYAGLLVLVTLILGALYGTGVLGTREGAPATDRSPRTALRAWNEQRAPSPGVIAEDRINHVLDETPLGRAARTWNRRHHVNVVYRPRGGSYYYDAGNTIYVDTSQSPAQVAAVYVHETNHAAHRNEPDVHKLSRTDYVDRSLDEEAHGTVLQIQENQQLQAVPGSGKVPDTIMQRDYEPAYAGAVSRAERQAKAHGRRLTTDEKRRIGAQAGERRVKQAFADGEVVRSTDGGNYVRGYGQDWDDAHTKESCFLWVACG